MATVDTVVVDFGGPGAAVLSGANNVSGFVANYPELNARYNLLVVEEPWVTRDVVPTCRASLSYFYEALRSPGTDAALLAASAKVRGDCQLVTQPGEWAFSPQSYRELVQAIARKHALNLVGFVGHSWGSVRLSYLQDLPIRWAILARPYPIGVSVGDLIAGRALAMDELKVRLLSTKPAAIAKLDRSRSLPVTTFDRLSAVVELGYVDDSMVSTIGPGVENGSDVERIGLLSDELWGRSNVNDISPRLLSFLGEVCPISGRPATVNIDSLDGLLSAQFSACSGSASYVPRISAGIDLCVVVGSRDSVTPATLVRSAMSSLPQTRWVVSDVAAHSSFDGLGGCLKSKP
jgi:pimeloyl-ACP methyl ester carboxylesterase